VQAAKAINASVFFMWDFLSAMVTTYYCNWAVDGPFIPRQAGFCKLAGSQVVSGGKPCRSEASRVGA
jgi:hypothetical protein